ncbi:MAG: hypothetical protein IJT03_02980 [Clostridia bacterium]|nr:hypothetical protein [Clostridia bacterium]
MIRIVKSQLLDIVPLELGFIYAEKAKLNNGQDTVAFYVYDQDGDRTLPVKIKMYLEAKYGYQYREIAKKLGNYIACDSVILKSGGVATLFDDGSMNIFDSDGTIAMQEKLVYQGCPIRSIALDGNCFWCAVPDRNSIVKFSPIEKRVLLRIGGGASVAFRRPVSVFKNDNLLFVCNEYNNTVRTINLKDYSVKDYLKFKEPVKKYFKVGFFEYVVLDSGVYCLEDKDK